jgi:hypothetical protein
MDSGNVAGTSTLPSPCYRSVKLPLRFEPTHRFALRLTVARSPPSQSTRKRIRGRGSLKRASECVTDPNRNWSQN